MAHVTEALEQAHQARTAAASQDARHQVVMEQIADALIHMQWTIEQIAGTVLIIAAKVQFPGR